MPGPTTESLSGEMKVLADRIDAVSEKLTHRIDAVSERLAVKVDAGAREFAAFREEMARFRGRNETKDGITRWLAALVAASILTLFLGILRLTWEAAKLDSRVGALEQATGELTKAIKLNTAP